MSVCILLQFLKINKRAECGASSPWQDPSVSLGKVLAVTNGPAGPSVTVTSGITNHLLSQQTITEHLWGP